MFFFSGRGPNKKTTHDHHLNGRKTLTPVHQSTTHLAHTSVSPNSRDSSEWRISDEKVALNQEPLFQNCPMSEGEVECAALPDAGPPATGREFRRHEWGHANQDLRGAGGPLLCGEGLARPLHVRPETWTRPQKRTGPRWFIRHQLWKFLSRVLFCLSLFLTFRYLYFFAVKNSILLDIPDWKMSAGQKVPQDAKKEEFRKYLEKAGVLELLTKSLVQLYEVSYNAINLASVQNS